MLEIVKFIYEHEDWETLLSNAPYNLKISWDDGFVLFKYNQINSDFNEKICREARGLILDSTQNFKVVRLAFERFFNLGESFAAQLDWDTAVGNEKLDGSIMSVWFARGKWHLSTNSTIDAFKAELNGVSPYKSFGELFESVLPLSWFENNVSNRIAHMCYTFELVSPHNKVVINYPKTKVYLLSIRNMNTLVEYPLDEVAEFAKRFSLTMPQFYYMNDEDGFRRLVEQMPEGHEGIVVRDAAGRRVKIKTPLYFKMHRAKNNGIITLEHIVDLIRANDQYELLSYFCEYQSVFDNVKRQIDNTKVTLEKVRQDVALWKNEHPFPDGDRTARKWFAQDFGQVKYAPLYFAEYDGRLDGAVESLDTKKFISMFKIELKEGV